jgi:hypothetical protein
MAEGLPQGVPPSSYFDATLSFSGVKRQDAPSIGPFATIWRPALRTATSRRKRAFRGVRLKKISGSDRRENPTTGDSRQLAIF